MKNEELIRQLAEPILKKLLEIEENSVSESAQVPVVRLCLEEGSAAGDPLIDEQLIRDLEAYVQDELEAWYKPTVLH